MIWGSWNGLAVLGFSVLLLAACGGEAVPQAPVEKIIERTVVVEKEVLVVATPTPGPTAAATSQSSGPQIYQLGIFENLTTVNYWTFLGPDTTGDPKADTSGGRGLQEVTTIVVVHIRVPRTRLQGSVVCFRGSVSLRATSAKVLASCQA